MKIHLVIFGDKEVGSHAEAYLTQEEAKKNEHKHAFGYSFSEIIELELSEEIKQVIYDNHEKRVG